MLQADANYYGATADCKSRPLRVKLYSIFQRVIAPNQTTEAGNIEDFPNGILTQLPIVLQILLILAILRSTRYLFLA